MYEANREQGPWGYYPDGHRVSLMRHKAEETKYSVIIKLVNF